MGVGISCSLETLLKHVEDALDGKVYWGWGISCSLETLLKHVEDALECKV